MVAGPLVPDGEASGAFVEGPEEDDVTAAADVLKDDQTTAEKKCPTWMRTNLWYEACRSAEMKSLKMTYEDKRILMAMLNIFLIRQQKAAMPVTTNVDIIVSDLNGGDNGRKKPKAHLERIEVSRIT